MKKLRKALTISLLSGILMVTGTGMAYADEIDQADVMNTIQSEDFKQVFLHMYRTEKLMIAQKRIYVRHIFVQRFRLRI